MDGEGLIVVLSNVPDSAIGQHIARQIIEQRLAACVNISAEILSIYNWNGQQQAETEVQLSIKTTEACYARLEALITELHPYDLPEIIAIPLTAASPAYQSWVRKETV
jgi:periplasmic divalent cation tolerance protein